MMLLKRLNWLKKVNNVNTTDTSNLVVTADYDTKIGEVEKKITDHDHINKHITTQEFNKLTSKNFAARLQQGNLESKNDIADFSKYIYIYVYIDSKLNNLKKANSNKRKHKEVKTNLMVQKKS